MWYARAGRPSQAVADLTGAVELNPTYRADAVGDEDFAGLRENPEFKALTGGYEE